VGVAQEQLPNSSGGGGGCCPANLTPFIYVSGGNNFSNVDEALRFLLLQQNPLSISFSGGGTYEIGQNGTNTPALQNVILNWSTNKTGNIAYIRINRGMTVVASTDPSDLPITLINVSDITHTHVGAGISSNTTYTITITSGDDPTDTQTANTSFTFQNRVFWGPSSLASDNLSPLSETQIESIFNTELRGSRNFTKTLVNTNQYMYFVIPTAFGSVSPTPPSNTSDTPEFIVSGFSNNAWVTYQVNITNSWGYNQNYIVFRSVFQQNATHTVQILG
jgi:hypothetical protein